ALENTDRCRFVHLADQAAQDRPRLRAQIGAANGIEAQIQAFERQTEFARVLDLLDVAEHDQRIEQPERGCVVEVCAPRDFGENKFRLVACEGLEHAKALREGIDDILVGDVGHFVRNANFNSPYERRLLGARLRVKGLAEDAGARNFSLMLAPDWSTTRWRG